MAGFLPVHERAPLYSVKKSTVLLPDVCSSPPLNILIFGSSYIKRLAVYLSHFNHVNLDLDRRVCRVTCWGHGGLLVRNDPHGRLSVTNSRFSEMDIIMLHLGSNDLCDILSFPSVIARDVFDFAKDVLCVWHPKLVIISQLLPRQCEPYNGYNAKILVTNMELEALCFSERYITSWRHRAGLHRPLVNIYAADGIHLSNMVGNYKLMKSLRDALLRGMRYHLRMVVRVMSKRGSKRPLDEGSGEPSTSGSCPMSTAEDRLTEILIKKLIDRGLVSSIPTPTPQSTASASTTSTSASEFTASTSTSTASTPGTFVPLSTTSTGNNQSVFSVNAGALFQPADIPDANSAKSDLGMSISRHVSEKLQQDIWMDKFVEFSSLLPGAVPSQLSLNFSESDVEPVLKITSSQKARILNLDQWQHAFSIFMDVLIQKSPQLTSSLLVYQNLVTELARLYGIKAMQFYDTQFRMNRQSCPHPWNQIHADYWLRATTLYGTSSVNQSKTTKNTKTSNSNGNTCWGFNSQSGCKRTSCRFAHVCSRCGYTHPAINCYAKVRKNTQNQSDRTPPSVDYNNQTLTSAMYPPAVSNLSDSIVAPPANQPVASGSNAGAKTPNAQSSRYIFRKASPSSSKSADPNKSK
ncbi:hypothetical protein LOTGIDRAFT_176355 [Lottia gigantea]|uniref:C3H1-type domain-containing protein n=1 Tax=Lottia gigantea TaxID=225164 RepID=V4AJC5_LOTGI|nr:hypothetical protein LOTGIDRAFT_176355 [Lottia gigantea]ESP04284.1 hypothetical protein LOTGIDRAFT_176355 [Lottia gigantea]